MLGHNESFAEMLHTPIPRVLIAICTYQRPIMLDACLSSLLRQETDYSFSHSIAVIDNDMAMSAHPVVCRAISSSDETLIHYMKEPKRGIARARNHALNFARKNGYTHLAFMDDDEIAAPDWIKSLMHPDYLDTPILGGRKIMSYGSNIPEWARPKHNPKPPAGEGAYVGKVATSNMRIGPHLLNCPFNFDETIGLGGGEDSDFVMRAAKLGFEVRHTNRAVTYETAHPERMTIRGQANRTFWYAASNLRLDMLHKGNKWIGVKKIPTIIGSIPHGLFLGLLGACIWPVRPNKGKRTILKGAKLIAKGQGYLAALMGHIPQSYAKTVGA